jgi:hypothetical protein
LRKKVSAKSVGLSYIAGHLKYGFYFRLPFIGDTWSHGHLPKRGRGSIIWLGRPDRGFAMAKK